MYSMTLNHKDIEECDGLESEGILTRIIKNTVALQHEKLHKNTQLEVLVVTDNEQRWHPATLYLIQNLAQYPNVQVQQVQRSELILPFVRGSTRTAVLWLHDSRAEPVEWDIGQALRISLVTAATVLELGIHELMFDSPMEIKRVNDEEDEVWRTLDAARPITIDNQNNPVSLSTINDMSNKLKD